MSETAVLVGNLSPKVTEKELQDFFAFCGPISGFKMYQVVSEDGETLNEAVIEFGSPKAADTALLLTNAIVHERPIAVTYGRGTHGAPLESLAQPATPGGSGQSPVEPEKRSHTSVVASLVAAGYVMAADALDHAKSMDEGYQVTATLLGAAAMIQQQSAQGYRMLADLMNEFDQQYGVSKLAHDVQTKVTTTAAGVDESLHLTDHAKDAYSRLDQGARQGVAKLSESPYMQNALQLWSQASEQATEYTRQVQEKATRMTEPVLNQGRQLVEGEIEGIKKAVDDAKAARRNSQEMKLAENAANKVSEAVDAASEAVSDAGEAVSMKAADVVDQAKEAL